jgi:nucleoid-associated protein
MSVISPRTGKLTASYFITALGCAKGTASAQATNTLIKEAVSFFKNTEDLKEKRFEFKNDLIDYLIKKAETGESVKLSEVEELARPYMSAEKEGQVDELADQFITHLNCEENAVPIEFPAHSSTIKKYTHISHKDDNWELKFSRIAIGDTEDAQIFFDRENQKITLKDIPDKLASKLCEELDSRTENN